MTESGIFPEGMLHEGKAYKDFTLDEETFGHTLGLINDPAIDAKRMDDPAYNAAALFSRRLTVEGIARITPDAVLGLSGPDGNELIMASITLESRRLRFRRELEAAPENGAGAAEAGAESAGDSAAASGGSQQSA
jgi:hypothetical protein